jgi:hypothetical protein
MAGTASSIHRLADRLAESRAFMFVGRAEALAAFRSVVTADPFSVTTAVIFVHGPEGVGKSTLLQRFADMAREVGRQVAQVSAKDMDPSRETFAAQAGSVLDDPAGVMIVDNFERCQELEPWLADELLPRLPVGALVVLAGRRPPGSRWREDLGWARALHTVRLDNLTPVEARELLDRLQVKSNLHDRLLALTHGHPLALRLAAEVVKRGDTSARAWKPDQALLRQLVERLVGDAPSPPHRRALEVCAHSLATTEAMLRAVVGEEAPYLFDWLRRQSFIELNKYGLAPHDLVRDIIDADFRWRDPDGYQQMHAEISRYVIEKVQNPAASDCLPAAFSWTYLLRRDGFLSRFLTWQHDAGIFEDVVRDGDRAKIRQLIESAEGSQSADIAEFWLSIQPEAFHVYRATASAEPIAVLGLLRLTPDMADLISRDPITAAAWEHMRENQSLRAGEGFSVARYQVAGDVYQRPSVIMDLMIHRCLVEIFRAKKIAWDFVVLANDSFWDDFMWYFNKHKVRDVVSVGGRSYAIYAKDWRRLPLRQWMELRTSVELPDPMAKRGNGLDGGAEHTAVLSRSEFDKAVVDALESLHRRDRLARNPLTRTRMVAGPARPVAQHLRTSPGRGAETHTRPTLGAGIAR